jgi:hypothetical protein
MTPLTINVKVHSVHSEVLGNITVKHHNDWYDKSGECQISFGGGGAFTIIQQRSYTRAPVKDWHAVRRNQKKVHRKKKWQIL